MINPDTEQVFLLSDYFHQLGNALGAYIQNNKLSMADDERNELNDDQINLLQVSADINMLGVSLVFEDVRDTINQLNKITTDVNKAVKKALAVQDIINLATSLVSIGTAIITNDQLSLAKYSFEAAKTLQSLKLKA